MSINQPENQQTDAVKSLPYEERLSRIGAKTKLQEIRDKETAREKTQFGAIPVGSMRDRAESQLDDVRTDPIPIDLINAFDWASGKGLTQKYIRLLIKQKEGSLPLVGGTLPYSREGLETLWRNDLQTRREKGIRKSNAARYKAERMKLALEELDEIRARRSPTEQDLRAQIAELESSNRTLVTAIGAADQANQDLELGVQALEELNDQLESENRLVRSSKNKDLPIS